MQAIGLALMLVFAGGAVGKFLCGALAERLGVIRTVIITEVATGGAILVLLALPLAPALVLLPVLGVALNGTSSVLYGTVADLVTSDRRARSYGILYTLGSAPGPRAPCLRASERWGGPDRARLVGIHRLLPCRDAPAPAPLAEAAACVAPARAITTPAKMLFLRRRARPVRPHLRHAEVTRRHQRDRLVLARP